MKIIRMFVPVLFVLLSLHSTYSQDKPVVGAPAAQADAPRIPLKAQMVITDYDGTKKISSMPYTIMFMASHADHRDSIGSVRIGVRVPVTTQKGGENGTANNAQYTYIDVGTNIDCWAYKWEGDRYMLSGNIDVSSVYAMDFANQPVEWKSGAPTIGSNPIIRHTNGSFTIALRDGQAEEATIATDPITGHVFKVEVTLTVVK